MTYDWQASLATLVFIIAVTVIGKFLVFQVPALKKAREHNLAEDKRKMGIPKYPPNVKRSQRIGLAINIIFFAGILPWFVTMDSQPWWRILVDAFAILMIYDFFYYMTHRFLFHGKSFMRQVHAVHHQARNISHVDAFYLHPVETVIGISLYFFTVAGWALFMGELSWLAVGIGFVVFTQINTINHTHLELPYFPFKTLNWIAAKHAVHHVNMHKGNYATITLLYDKLFGTLE